MFIHCTHQIASNSSASVSTFPQSVERESGKQKDDTIREILSKFCIRIILLHNELHSIVALYNKNHKPQQTKSATDAQHRQQQQKH